jgi:putative protease
MGVSRIILSRELSLEEIKEIRNTVSDIELESFVHGAICIAYSGRCLLSSYFNNRDPNQGTCTNSCRWRYKVYTNDIRDYYLEEGERPGTLMPVTEDEFGTYILNSKDLCTIKILEQLINSGIDSFKIEGRTKSVYYLSVITRAYRIALDNLFHDTLFDKSLEHEMYAVANRGYTTGFLEKNPASSGQNYTSSQSENQTHLFCGKIYDFDAERMMASISVRNPIKTGDILELVSPPPAPIQKFKLKAMYSMDSAKIDRAHGGGKEIKLVMPFYVPPFSLLRKIIVPE